MKELLEHYITARLPDTFLLITCGLPGTGKTTASHMVHRIKGAVILRSDLIRREVIREDIFEPAIAADKQKRELVYAVMFHRAEEAIREKTAIILDATFFAQPLRRHAAAIAEKHKRPFIILETVCPPEVALKRILARQRNNEISNALTEEAYLNNRREFQTVDMDDLKKHFPQLELQHITVDTTLPPPDWYVVGEEIQD